MPLHLTAAVLLMLQVATGAARALVGPVELQDASVNAAKGWRFTPTRLSNRPVRVLGAVTFNFNL